MLFGDGEASALEKKIIEEHLNACLSCQEEVIRIKDSISLLKTQDIQKAPEGFAKETMLLIKERQEYREERGRRHPSGLCFVFHVLFCKGFVEGRGIFEIPAASSVFV